MSTTCMLVQWILIFLYINPWVSSFHLYHTKHVLNNGDHDCLYRYVKTANKLGRHLIPYCIRWIEQQETNDLPCLGTNYTFSALRHANITVTDLYNWHAAIDLIADYALYLEINDDTRQIFCNCSDVRRFGHRCQYIFAFNSSDFGDIIEETFALNNLSNPSKRKFDVRYLTEADITCYLMFNCTTYIDLCLDWRQICDSIRDCTNGRDEENCLQMELNECDPNTEYRCRNGMCIPRSFSFDLTMDCMDFYDEQRFHDISRYCSNQSSIDCEDHSCGIARFSCGDGSCSEEYNLEIGSHIYEECDSQRNSLQLKSIFQYKNNTSITYDCWKHMMCLLGLSCLYDQAGKPSRCYEGVYYTARYCKENKKSHLSCPEKFFFPPTHFVLPFVRLLYTNKPYTYDDKAYFSPPIAICYNRSVCNLDAYMNYSSVQKPDDFGGYECQELLFFSIWQIPKSAGIGISQASILAAAVHNVFSHCSVRTNFSKSLYICPSGRLISPHRIYDRHMDCFPMMNDEGGVASCARNLSDRFRCREDTNPVCIPRRLLRDNQRDCRYGSEEYFPVGCTHEYDCQYLRYFDLQMRLPVFYKDLCDGYAVIRKSLENIETDETSCEEWSCNARAIRCNGVWNRPNGCDELNCPGTIPDFITRHVANCSTNEHYCLQYNRSQIACLPVTRANDGIVDCLFRSDERLTMNLVQPDVITVKSYVYCHNSSDQKIQVSQICNRAEDCDLAEDELLCPWHMQSSCPEFTCKNGTCLPISMRCNRQIDCLEAEDEWTCDFENDLFVRYLQLLAVTDLNLVNNEVQHTFRKPITDLFNNSIIFSCHRGIVVYDTFAGYRCFCPSSYYGKQCEYQSERLTVSFILEMTTMVSVEMIYQLVFYLLDGQENVLTVETLVYAPSIHSSLKHLIMLMYPRGNRSISSFGNLSLRIDGYIVTTQTVQYSLSWLFPVQFPFLPVNRLAVRLLTEQRSIDSTACIRLGCKHGICQTFSNSDRHVCRCFPNWIGLICDQRAAMPNCSQISTSVTVNRHTSCVCPLGRSGIECRTSHNRCYGIRCENGGSCFSLDIRTEEQVCICKEHYFGDNCQYKDAHLLLDTPRTISRIPVLIIHFLHSPKNLHGILMHRGLHLHSNVQTGKQLLIHDSNQHYLPTFIIAQLVVTLSSPYGSFYLVDILTSNQTNLTTSILEKNRCPHVNEYLNSTMMSFEWLKRVKFYHKYLQNVRCFYDEIYMCLVDDQQMPECLHFNHGISNCTDHNYCENAGRCYQSKQSGHLNFACACPECAAGAFCQIKMSQFFLTLDSMLGETIVTGASWNQQPTLITILTSFVVLIFITGIISNLMSCLTFINHEIRQYGCGNYLFVLSIACQLTIVVFAGRFTYLLVSQMTTIVSRRLLTIGCTLFDFFLSLLASLCDWLTACIACERTMSTVKGVLFNRTTSVHAVKIVVPLLITVLVLTSIHLPFTRALISDPYNKERFWCVIKFGRVWLQHYTFAINILNTIVPFLINLASAIILLLSFARTKRRTDRKKSYRIVLIKQFRQHKDLIISPIFMIIFKLPLVIIMFMIHCIQSQWQLYLTLAAYCLSLISLTATFIIFVVPAPSYFKIFLNKWNKLYAR